MELQLPELRRRAVPRATPRTQSSIALSENGSDWLLVNASPDIPAQVRATPALQPARSQRDSGIAAVLLMDAQIDHVTGLLMLREHGRPLLLYATAPVLADLDQLSCCGASCPTTAAWRPTCCRSTAARCARRAAVAGLDAGAARQQGAAVLAQPRGPQHGDNIGLRVVDTRSGARCSTPRAGRDRAARDGRAAGGRRGAGGRHLLAGRRDAETGCRLRATWATWPNPARAA